MYWWYKDVFVDRYTHDEPKRDSNIGRVKRVSVTGFISRLKQKANTVIEHLRYKRMIKQSYQVLRKLDDHQLTDIGLTREAVYLTSKGIQPVRYQDNAALILDSPTFELVSDTGVGIDETKTALTDEPYDRAA